MSGLERVMAILDIERPRRERKLELRYLLLARLGFGLLYIGLLLAMGAPPWAFVLAAISATYWGPVR